MNSYNFMTIHTLVDISGGVIPSLGELYFGENTNVSRLIDIIMMFSPPFLTRVDSEVVNFNKAKNCNFYRMKHLRGTGEHTIHTIKFAVSGIDVQMFADAINGMPVIVPTRTSAGIQRKFITEDTVLKNTTILENNLLTRLS